MNTSRLSSTQMLSSSLDSWSTPTRLAFFTGNSSHTSPVVSASLQSNPFMDSPLTQSLQSPPQLTSTARNLIPPSPALSSVWEQSPASAIVHQTGRPFGRQQEMELIPPSPQTSESEATMQSLASPRTIYNRSPSRGRSMSFGDPRVRANRVERGTRPALIPILRIRGRNSGTVITAMNTWSWMSSEELLMSRTSSGGLIAIQSSSRTRAPPLYSQQPNSGLRVTSRLNNGILTLTLQPLPLSSED